MRNEFIALTAALGLCACASAPASPGDAGVQGAATASVTGREAASMTCVQMADEAARLSATMGGEPEGSVFGMLGGVARAGAAALIPGAGLVIAGADTLTQPGRDREEAETQAARNRWHYLNGAYAGRRCHERAEAAVETNAAAAVPVR